MKVATADSLPMMESQWSSWIPYSDLSQRIQSLAKTKFNGTLSVQQQADLKYCVKLAQSWTWPANKMRDALSQLSPEIIKKFMLQILSEGNFKEIDYYFNCLDLLNKEVVLELSNFKTLDIARDSFKLHGLTKSTALANGLEKEKRAIVNEFLFELKQYIHHFLQILITLSGINEVFREKHNRYRGDGAMNSYEAKAKIEAYWTLFAYPVVVFGAIYSYLQLAIPALALTSIAVVASLVALVAYNRYGKPCPIDCDGLKYLNVQVLNDNDPIYPRQDILKKIEAAFKAKKGVLLVGGPGSGKSMVVKSLVKQALEGKICDFINDPHFFGCNATLFKLLGQDGNFMAIEERFKNHAPQVVFFFDEFAALFKKEGMQGNILGDQIKTFWETFRYTIGATTLDEYNTYIKDQPAIAGRRFEVIEIGDLEAEQNKALLYQQLEGANSKLLFDPAVIDYILQKAASFNSKTSIVDAAQSLLNAAIKKMTSTTHTDLEEDILKLEDTISVLTHQARSGAGGLSITKLVETLETKHSELKKVNQELEEKNQQTQKLLNMEDQLLKLKKQAYQFVDPKTSLLRGSTQEREWLKLHACIQLLSESVSMKRQELGFPTILDKKLIDTLLEKPKVANASPSI